MKQILIGLHRGIFGDENSFGAINNALQLNEINFVEFDVILKDNILKTGHFYNTPVDDFNDVIFLFRNSIKFPKIDIKIKNNNYKQIIERVFDRIINERLNFVLINISGSQVRKRTFMSAEKFLVDLVIHYNSTKKIFLNIDLERYVKKDIYNHLNLIKNHVFSISPEINYPINDVINVCKTHGIRRVMFWFDKNKICSEEDFKVKVLEKSKAVLKENLILMFDAGLKEFKIMSSLLNEMRSISNVIL